MPFPPPYEVGATKGLTSVSNAIRVDQIGQNTKRIAELVGMVRAAGPLPALRDVYAALRQDEILGSVRLAGAALDAAGVVTLGLALRRPSLDDVFLTLTGHAAEEEEQPNGRKRGARRRERAAS